MLSLKDFKKIRLEDKSIFDTHYQHHPPMHSGELFTTMISWAEYVEYHYAKIHDSIIISSKDNNGTVLHAPSGTFDQDLFTQVMKLANKGRLHLWFYQKNRERLSFETLSYLKDHRG